MVYQGRGKRLGVGEIRNDESLGPHSCSHSSPAQPRVHLLAKFSTMCLMLSSVRRGTVARDHSGSSAMILRMLRQSAAGLSLEVRSGISASSWPTWWTDGQSD